MAASSIILTPLGALPTIFLFMESAVTARLDVKIVVFSAAAAFSGHSLGGSFRALKRFIIQFGLMIVQFMGTQNPLSFRWLSSGRLHLSHQKV